MTAGAGRRGTALLTALALTGGALLTGCGSSSLSATQLSKRADKLCTTGQQLTDRVHPPSQPSGAASFLTGGIDALGPQVTALAKLRPTKQMKTEYARALGAAQHELSLMRAARTNLGTSGDAVSTVRTLQSQLVPVRAQARTAWSAVGASTCTTLFG